MSEYAIEVRNLRKKFCRSLKRSLLYGTMDVFRAMAGFPNQNPDLRTSEFWALDELSFSLKRGESLGLIGANGCGKSTLLRLLSGIFPPDEGEIQIRGRMASLIAVGAGFHPHMSGAENIYLNGVLLGMNRAEIKKRFDDIVDFSEIGDFIEAPVSTYSSGMRVRLGFSIAVHTKPEILLVDEVMSVGDTRFRRKASDAMTSLLKNEQTTLILVSHVPFTVKQQCENAILLDHGRCLFHGDVDEAYDEYAKLLEARPLDNESHGRDFQNFRLWSSDGDDVVNAHEPAFIEFKMRDDLASNDEIPVKVTIFDRDNGAVLSLQAPQQVIQSGTTLRFTVPPSNLVSGKYRLQLKVGSSFHGVSIYQGHGFVVVGQDVRSSTAVCLPLELATILQ